MKRSIVIAGHKTSISLEDAFWSCLREIATDKRMPISELVASIEKERQHPNLSSALRCFILRYYQDRVESLKNNFEVTGNPMP